MAIGRADVARRQPSVQVVSGVMNGLVVDFHATLLVSGCVRSAGAAGAAAGGGTTLATRWNSEGGRPMWKSAPSGPAMCRGHATGPTPGTRRL